MRTTINIDEDLLAAAKELARRGGTSVGRVVSELVRQALNCTLSRPDEIGKSGAHYGFRPFPARGKIVSDKLVERMRDEADI